MLLDIWLDLASTPAAVPVAIWLAYYGLNLVYTCVTSSSAEVARRLQFIALMWPQNLVAVLGKYAVLYLALRKSPLFWMLILPLSVYETTSIQAMADLFEGRPLKAPTLSQVSKQVKIAVAEMTGLYLSYRMWPWLMDDPFTGPTATSLIHAIWRATVFDIGLDVGFYAFHRSCHVNRTLYRLVHATHHTDTGKEHGHLVAYETYELSIVETFSILSSYIVGFELLSLFYQFSMSVLCLRESALSH